MAIVDATVAEVAARGWGAATVEGIAARAGVGKATIYRRWRGKEELFRFVATRVTDRCDGVDRGDLRSDLVEVFRPMTERLSERDLARLLPTLMAEAVQDDAIRGIVREFAQQRRRPALAAVERARARGEVGADTDADALVDMVAGALIYRVLVLAEPVDGRAAERVVDQAVRCARPPTIAEEAP